MTRLRFIQIPIWILFPKSVLIVACGLEVQKTSPEPITQRSYLALGDSYTIGTGITRTDTFPAQLSSVLSDYNLGAPTIIAQNGWTTEDLLAGMATSTLEEEYDLVTVLIGVNNQFQARSMEKLRTEFDEILNSAVSLAGGKPGRVIVISIPDWGVTPFAQGFDQDQISTQIDQYNQVARGLAQEAGVRYSDITTISRLAHANPSLLSADGLHPSRELYGLWVQQLMPTALDALNTE